MTMRVYTLIDIEGNEIKSWEEPHGSTRIGRWIARTPKEFVEAGHRWVIMEKGKYHVYGPWYTFRYRLKRSLFIFEHIGLQKIWVTGVQEPYYFHDKTRSLGPLTAGALYDVTEADPIDRLMVPRKTDWVVLVLVVIIGIFVGLTVGRAV